MNWSLLPRDKVLENSLSIVLAATVNTQGATFTTVPGCGPSFPAEATTTILLASAWNAPMETSSVNISSALTLFLPPAEMVMTSTPSLMAWSIADNKSAPKQLVSSV